MALIPPRNSMPPSFKPCFLSGYIPPCLTLHCCIHLCDLHFQPSGPTSRFLLYFVQSDMHSFFFLLTPHR
ncbi:hypothetical protein NEUTE1DRAFT_119288 [Neurospora tetrasperma FGSC 2508]|uniref:Uncharacterized protein n=1 Tax=Neurospora tetrasperma (strain FGSC 2508 / ATCC MYA-4615 / P0657) TaxID=510951 RepID=F8MZM7_NEUT8|nr:uncharacterized protein NEUTE1DRAFT_119288 [Neurospora tetrasperma FGSC 2508]EGO53717.1 hypothetical protein NEUTE1DRAFT_119288 [Neurospora tetrasperma FGSC 2508]